nr:group II intron maturase-specific domain protein [Oedogonium sp. 260-2_chl]
MQKILKFKKIFYKSGSLILFILCKKSLKNLEREKLKNFLSKNLFQRILTLCLLKKETQIYSLFNSRLKLHKKLKNLIEKGNSSCFAPCCSFLFLDFFKKQLFWITFIFFYECHIQLSYFSFLNYLFNFTLLQIFQYEFLNRAYDPFFLLLLKNNILFFNTSLNKNNIHSFFFVEYHYLFFQYRKFDSCYYHNYFLNTEKKQYQNIYYFHLFSNNKYENFFYYNKKKFIFYRTMKSIKNKLVHLDNKILKNRFFYYYSMIFIFPCCRQNRYYVSIELLNKCNNITKKLLEKLNKMQKQILLFFCEPIWEASFEISLYSSRRGRSLFDALEFLRGHLKEQPIFLFKTYLTFFTRFLYKSKKYMQYSNEFIFFSKKLKTKNTFLIFFCFFENVIFHGVQKKYQNYYLVAKQQIFLYQIINILKKNTKNKISFCKIFYNNHFLILSIHNPIYNKFEKKNISNKIFKNKKMGIKNYKQFILKKYQTIFYNKFENKVKIFLQHFLCMLKSNNFLIKNCLIFSLSDFFYNKISSIKQRLFSLQLKKQYFSFYLEKMCIVFPSLKSKFPQKELFSIFLKDSCLFISKNTFLFFFKNKKVFFQTNMLMEWSHEKYCFFKRIKKKNQSLVKKFNYYINNIYIIHKLRNFFVFSTKIFPTQWNYKILVKIILFFFYGYYRNFFTLSSFHNILFNFLLFIKKFFNKQISSKKFFLILFYFNLYGKILFFFQSFFQNFYIIYSLKKNDINFVFNSFIKYKNIILYFNYNYSFLKSFKTILKKSLILNSVFLFLCLKKNVFNCQTRLVHYSKSFIFYSKNLLLNYLKKFFNSIQLNLFSKKNTYFNSKKINQIEKTGKKYFILKSIWSIKFFRIKKKHTFLFYKKHLNGFYYFNFFIAHKNKNNKKLFANSLFFWQFYYINILMKCQYIQSISKYYQVVNFSNKNIRLLKYKQFVKIFKFYFYQSFFFKDSNSVLWKFNKYFQILIIFSLCYGNKFSSLLLFNLIFSKIFQEKFVLLFYKKVIQQEKLKIYYYFSIKPSQKHIQKHLFQISNIVKKNSNKNQEYIIFKLSKIIKNWCFYYQTITSTMFYKYIDYLTFQILWKWACRRHYKKSKQWIKLKYFYKFNFIYNKLKKKKLNKILKKKIIFAYQLKYSIDIKKIENEKNFLKQWFGLKNYKSIKNSFICLPNHTDIILIKHQIIQNDRSPFDIDFIYWINRNIYY